ncbi:MAG TPA: hypothetical protein VKB50_05105 [Vicinamibacterales bacterium]|nr:hypothetical protein [Vicinamibacterales bacterium]
MKDRRERPHAMPHGWSVQRATGSTVPSTDQPRKPDPFRDDRRAGEVDRRNNTSRAALVERFRAEFRDMPGLWVTCAEARRLFGVPEDICQRVLDQLVAERLLIRTADGIYRPPPRTGNRRS